jgi:tetratricopeptide (TPR) repeat protein
LAAPSRLDLGPNLRAWIGPGLFSTLLVDMSSAISNKALFAGLLVAMTLVVYRPVLDNGFIWDDDDYVVDNPTLRTAEGLRRIWLDYGATPQYYPMVHSTFWVEYQLWQLEPVGYHVVNVLLHALGVVLLWRLLSLLELPGAWLAAAIFAVHPVNVESVAWITERKNVLSGVFYLASLFAYIRSAAVGNDAMVDPRSGRFYALSLVSFACALLCKTVTGSLPAVILLVLWWKRGRIGWAEARPLLAFFVLAAGFGALTVQLETQHVGAVGRDWDLSFVDRCLVAGRALWFYAFKLLWPAQLVFNYPRWEIDAGRWLSYCFPAAVLVAVAALWAARRRIGRGPLVAVLAFAGTLFPALGFFDVYPMRYSFVADHFQYLASPGLIALFAAGAATAAARIFRGRTEPAAVAAAILLVVLGALTWRQTQVYGDLETLWRDTLAKNPDSWMAHVNLGVIVEDRGQVEEAVRHYRESLRIQPVQHEAYNNLGSVLRTRGEFDEAIAQLRRSLDVKPDYIFAYNNLGLVYHDRGEYGEAVRHFQRSLEIHPDFAAAHTNLGITLAAQGKWGEAIQHHREALRIEPDLPQAHTNLATALIERGEIDEAIAHLLRAVQLLPESDAAKRNLRAALRLRARRSERPPSPEER